MTSLLRRKRRITARGLHRILTKAPARTLGSLAVALLLSARSLGQESPPPLPPALPAQPLPLSGAPATPPGMPVPSPIIPARYQDVSRYGRNMATDEVDSEFQIHTEIPSLNQLTKRDSEQDFFERIRQEARQRMGSERVPFPEETPLSKERYQPRPFPPLVKFVEPSYVAYRRLTYEQPNWERAGWDLGPLQPFICLGEFYFDTITQPYQMCKRPFEQTDTSAGKCLPGDPDPLVLYPPELSVTGFVGEAAVVTSGALIFPSWLMPK